jgi:hypothetical protein
MNNDHLRLLKSSKYIKYLTQIGIETENIYEMIVSKFNENDFNQFFNRSENLLSPNIYIEELAFSIVCKYLNEKYQDSVIFEDDSKLDIRTIVAHSKTLIQRPKILTPSETISGFKEPSYENDFIRISRFEKQLNLKDYGNTPSSKSIILFEGLLPIKIEVNPLKQELPSHHIWNNSFYIGQPFIQGLCRNINSLEPSSILWLNSELIGSLELTIDDYKNGLRALNNSGEVILEFRHWKKKLIGNGSSFVGTDSNIAKFDGSDLMLRKDYYEKLKWMIPNLVFYTNSLII